MKAKSSASRQDLIDMVRFTCAFMKSDGSLRFGLFEAVDEPKDHDNVLTVKEVSTGEFRRIRVDRIVQVRKENDILNFMAV